MPSSRSAAPVRGVLAASGQRRARIAESRRLLARVEAVAERFARGGEAEDAVAACVVGAHASLFRHPGVYASERLEAVLRLVGEQLEPLPARERPELPCKVLHVATETYGVGGHTRAILRWIDRDRGRTHDVVTTAQRTVMPEALVAATAATGGAVKRLDPGAGWLERAHLLRGLSADADVVVLHCHYRDPLPTIAFSHAGARPPVITFNHADHQFWLGSSVTDVLLNVREIPAHGMRGVPSERVAMAPLPIFGGDGHTRPEPATRAERERARADVLGGLGWPQDATVLLTVGNPSKFSGPAGTRLDELVEPVLAELPEVRLLAIGAAGVPELDSFAQRHPGRVAVLGPVVGLAPVFVAADVYLESRPGGGGTTTAEAAAHGLPCLSMAPSEIEAQVLCTAPAYGNHVAASADAYRAELRELAGDPRRRAEWGERARAAVTAADAGWEPALERAYALAARLGPVAPAELARPSEEDGEMHVLTDFFQEATAAHHPPADLEGAIAALELAAATPAVRGLFQTLGGPDSVPVLDRQFATAFAAPPADPPALRAVIDEFRRLDRVRAAGAFVMALRPGDADAAVPVLEDALAAGPDVDVDLVLHDEPWDARPEWSLAVLAPGQPAADVVAPVHAPAAAGGEPVAA